jgi:hypothetical protein
MLESGQRVAFRKGPGAGLPAGGAAPRPDPPWIRVAPLVLAGLFLSSCFEPPVSEEIEVRFLAQGGIVATFTTKIRDVSPGKPNPYLAERIERTRRELAEGEDTWGRRIASLSPAAERVSRDLESGRLVQVTHRVFLKDCEELNALLHDAVSLVDCKAPADEAQIALYPLAGSRATSRQANAVHATLEHWSETFARYLSAGSRLYAYLKRHPDRAEACLTPVFDPFVDDKAKEQAPQPDEEEQLLVKAVTDAMAELTPMFDVPADGAYSPDELFHLVFDPFPAHVRIVAPAKVVEVEGFTADSDRSAAVPDTGLFGAFRSLEGRFLCPDLFAAYVGHGLRGGGKTFDVPAFAAKERTYAIAPSTTEVRDALVLRLQSAPVYRARWRTAGLAAEQREITGWDDPALAP